VAQRLPPVRLAQLLDMVRQENSNEMWYEISVLLTKMETDRLQEMYDYLKEIVDDEMYQPMPITTPYWTSPYHELYRAQSDLLKEVWYVLRNRRVRDHHWNDLRFREF
jgi:hypothetical protein